MVKTNSSKSKRPSAPAYIKQKLSAGEATQVASELEEIVCAEIRERKANKERNKRKNELKKKLIGHFAATGAKQFNFQTDPLHKLCYEETEEILPLKMDLILEGLNKAGHAADATQITSIINDLRCTGSKKQKLCLRSASYGEKKSKNMNEGEISDDDEGDSTENAGAVTESGEEDDE